MIFFFTTTYAKILNQMDWGGLEVEGGMELYESESSKGRRRRYRQ
jgi:hypothetical protein